MNAEQLNMIYWIIGFTVILFIVDWIWIKPKQENRQIMYLIKKLYNTDIHFDKKIRGTMGKGLTTIMCKDTFLQGIILVVTLRNLGCKLPIVVFYKDITEKALNFLKTLANVSVIDLSSKDRSPLYSQVYALLYSPFIETLYVEPDIVFFKDPEYLFNDETYKSTGALFWKDRKTQIFGGRDMYNWVRKLISYRKGDNRILNKQSASFQSQKIMLINKQIHIKALEKLLILTKESDTVSSSLDKEFYWISFELAKEPYAFVPSYPGIIGEMYMNVLCGHTLFLDTQDQPLCCDDGLFQDDQDYEITDFTHYAISEDTSSWHRNCLLHSKYISIPNDMKKMFNNFFQIVHTLKEQIL